MDRFAEIFGKKRPISWKFSGQIWREIDRFCTNLTSVFNVFFNRDNHLLLIFNNKALEK